MFQAEMAIVGTEDEKEYSLYDAVKNRWLAAGSDGGWAFTSKQPISLRALYDQRDDVGTVPFALNLLAWMRENAETGVIEDGRYVDATLDELKYIGVYGFIGKRPVMLPTGLEFDRDIKAKHTVFEVRGPIRVVDDHLSGYQKQYPSDPKTLKFKVVALEGRTKTVRVEHPRVLTD